jgi:hypothetical protein
VPLDQLDQDVQHLDVQLLHAVGVVATGGADVDVAQGLQLFAAAPAQDDDFHALRLGGFGGLDNVFAGAAGAERDQAVSAIKTLQRLQKRVAKEVKEAGRRRRRAKKEDENGVPKEKRPTIFTTPVTLKDELCVFLGKTKGSQMTPADVTRAFSAYVDSNKLKDAEKGHTIHPDAAMRKVLNVKDGEVLTYRNVQSYLYKLYVLPEKKKAPSA